MADKQDIIIKRIKKAGHGHHGGAWKVAYADFVTAMMCFFLVMWLMGADEETKQSISHYFNHPNTPWKAGGDPKTDTMTPMGEKTGQGDSVMNGLDGFFPEDLIQDRPLRNLKDAFAENRSLSQSIEDVLEGNIYAVDVNAEEIKFSLPENILFKTGSGDLTSEAKSYLNKLASLIKPFKGTMTIDGHTDDIPLKGSQYKNNWELSFGRAVSVMNYLVENQHIAENMIQPLGSGPRRTIASNTSSEGRAKNRRVEFTLKKSSFKTEAKPESKKK